MGCELLLSGVDVSASNSTTSYSLSDGGELNMSLDGHARHNVTALEETYEMVRHYVYHILLPVIYAFGVFGNVLNLTVFAKRRLRDGMSEIEKAATTGLMFLAVADLLFCLTGLVGHLLQPFASVYADSPATTAAFYFTVYDRAVFNSLLFISTWLVVVVSVERYLAVSHPFQARQFVRVRRTVVLNVAVYLLSFLFNIPLFLEWQIEKSECVEQCTCYMLVLGPYGGSARFQKIYTILWSVIGTFLPLSILVLCNIQFLVEIYRSQKAFGITTAKSHRSPQQRFTRITAILIAVIFMFLVLVCPSMFIGFLDHRLNVSSWPDQSFYRFRMAEVIFNMTQAVNFSVNFLLYCSLSREFRRTLNMMVCRWKHSVTSLASSPSKIRRSRSEMEDTAVAVGGRRKEGGCCVGRRSDSLMKKLSQWRGSTSSITKSNGITYV